jgi:hypothetical protein
MLASDARDELTNAEVVLSAYENKRRAAAATKPDVVFSSIRSIAAAVSELPEKISIVSQATSEVRPVQHISILPLTRREQLQTETEGYAAAFKAAIDANNPVYLLPRANRRSFADLYGFLLGAQDSQGLPRRGQAEWRAVPEVYSAIFFLCS